MPARSAPAPKMMLGFVVRRCAAAVGHEPTAEEFAAWANHYHDGNRTVCLFGRPISIGEARVILRHRGRPVSARSAAPHESLPGNGEFIGDNVTSFAAAVARLKAGGKGRS